MLRGERIGLAGQLRRLRILLRGRCLFRGRSVARLSRRLARLTCWSVRSRGRLQCLLCCLQGGLLLTGGLPAHVGREVTECIFRLLLSSRSFGGIALTQLVAGRVCRRAGLTGGQRRPLLRQTLDLLMDLLLLLPQLVRA